MSDKAAPNGPFPWKTFVAAIGGAATLLAGGGAAGRASADAPPPPACSALSERVAVLETQVVERLTSIDRRLAQLEKR